MCGVSFLFLAIAISVVGAEECKQIQEKLIRLENVVSGLKDEVLDLRAENYRFAQNLGKLTEKSNTAVAFFVRVTADYVESARTNIAFNHVITNVGGGWIPGTGSNQFVAPVAGNYAFTFSAGSPSTTTCDVYINKNGGEELVGVWATDRDSHGRTSSNSAVLQLNAGDRVAVQARADCRLRGSAQKHTAFSGFLIN